MDFVIVLLSVLLMIAIGMLVQQFRYRRRLLEKSSELLRVQVVENAKLRNHLAAEKAEKARLFRSRAAIDDEYKVLKDRLEASYNGAAYDREMREDAERRLTVQGNIIDKHSKHCDTILNDMVDGMVEQLKPQAEDEGSGWVVRKYTQSGPNV